MTALDDFQRQIKGYVLLEPLGSGGMGIVYRARQESLGRNVAVKFLAADTDIEGAAYRRFRAEALTYPKLSHDNVIKVFDISLEGPSTPWIAFELVDGPDLKTLLYSGRVQASESLCAQLLAGLAYIHGHSILHRDLKPANILVTSVQRLILTDFGLARRIDQSTPGITQQGHLVGTPTYMAPELLLGESATVASDLYAAGLIMYEIVSGKLVFSQDASLPITFADRLKEPLPPLRPGSSGVGARMIAMIHACLAADPRGRPRDANDALRHAGIAVLSGPADTSANLQGDVTCPAPPPAMPIDLPAAEPIGRPRSAPIPRTAGGPIDARGAPPPAGSAAPPGAARASRAETEAVPDGESPPVQPGAALGWTSAPLGRAGLALTLSLAAIAASLVAITHTRQAAKPATRDGSLEAGVAAGGAGAGGGETGGEASSGAGGSSGPSVESRPGAAGGARPQSAGPWPPPGGETSAPLSLDDARMLASACERIDARWLKSALGETAGRSRPATGGTNDTAARARDALAALGVEGALAGTHESADALADATARQDLTDRWADLTPLALFEDLLAGHRVAWPFPRHIKGEIDRRFPPVQDGELSDDTWTNVAKGAVGDERLFQDDTHFRNGGFTYRYVVRRRAFGEARILFAIAHPLAGSVIEVHVNGHRLLLREFRGAASPSIALPCAREDVEGTVSWDNGHLPLLPDNRLDGARCFLGRRIPASWVRTGINEISVNQWDIPTEMVDTPDNPVVQAKILSVR